MVAPDLDTILQTEAIYRPPKVKTNSSIVDAGGRFHTIVSTFWDAFRRDDEDLEYAEDFLTKLRKMDFRTVFDSLFGVVDQVQLGKYQEGLIR